MAKEEFDIKIEYEKLCKKYSELPSFEIINNEFEILAIEKPGLLSRAIRRRLNERLIFFCRILENLIYPSLQNVLSAYEASFFSEEEKKHFTELHKKLMIFERQNMLLDVNNSTEERDIEFVTSLFKEWQNFKNDLIKIVTKMEDTWKRELKEEGEKYWG